MTKNQKILKEFFIKELAEKGLVRFIGSVGLLNPKATKKLVTRYNLK